MVDHNAHLNAPCQVVGGYPLLQGLRYISNVTTDGGIAWSSSDLPGTFRANGLTCDAGGRCIATGSAPSHGQHRMMENLAMRGRNIIGSTSSGRASVAVSLTLRSTP